VRDELGALNHVTDARQVAAARLVTKGRLFTLGLPIFGPAGEPLAPDRPKARRISYRDWSDYSQGRVRPSASGMAYVDDGISIHSHGTTHVDALGHIIIDGKMFDGRPASEPSPGPDRASVGTLGERGIFTRAVIADVPRHLGVERLGRRHHVTLRQLQDTLSAQLVTPGPGDVLILRTGSLAGFYEIGPEAFFEEYSEPGLSYEAELVDWFRRNELSGLGSDTLSNELPTCPGDGSQYPLHKHLLHGLGIIFHEALWLEDIAADCAADGRWEGLYMSAPLKAWGLSGSPVNPMIAK
jgi:kynurenine formamidase